jgi:tetratricopeptide (TPR) repeat protein
MMALEPIPDSELGGERMRRTLFLVLLLSSLAIVAVGGQRNARITTIMPTFGVPGTTVTIRGAGFSGFESGSWIKVTASEPAPGAVEFNGVPGEIIFWQDDLITVKVPIGASTGPVRVVLPAAKLVLTGESFEVPYSKPNTNPVRRPQDASSETGRSLGDEARGESNSVADGFIKRGNAYYQKKDYRSAIGQYELALANSADSVEALKALSNAYSSLGMYAEAILALNKILTITPDNPGAYVSLSRYYSLSDQYQASADAGRMAIKSAPNNYMGYTNLCRAYNDLGRFEDAINTCKQALELKLGDGEASLYMGRAYQSLKQPAKAMPLFQKAVTGLLELTKQSPDDADQYYLLGNAYTETKQDEQAVRSYLRAIELKPRFPQARYNLGVILYILGRTKEALEQQDQLQGIDPTRAARLLQIIKSH